MVRILILMKPVENDSAGSLWGRSSVLTCGERANDAQHKASTVAREVCACARSIQYLAVLCSTMRGSCHQRLPLQAVPQRGSISITRSMKVRGRLIMSRETDGKQICPRTPLEGDWKTRQPQETRPKHTQLYRTTGGSRSDETCLATPSATAVTSNISSVLEAKEMAACAPSTEVCALFLAAESCASLRGRLFASSDHC